MKSVLQRDTRMARVEPMDAGTSSSYNDMTDESDSGSDSEFSEDEKETTSLSEIPTTPTLPRGPSSSRQDGVVVLVVSDNEEAKIGVADFLTGNSRESGWTLQETAVGVRIFTHSSGLRVVDTKPLHYVNYKSATAVGRRWISHNSLRRVVLGRFVLVFCAISGSILQKSLCAAVLSNDNCWMDVVSLLFKHKQTGVMFVVNEHESDMQKKHKDHIKYFIRNHGFSIDNILYAKCSTGNGESAMLLLHETLRRGELTSPSFSRLDSRKPRRLDSLRSMFKHNSCKKRVDPNASISLAPFRLDPAQAAGRRYSAWDPERVVLFGKTGSGKSTLAQMLTQGELTDSDNFTISSGVRGGTRDIHGEIGRGWYVVDTPGFGEPKHKESTITTKDVRDKICKYVLLLEGSFSHYIFVQRKDRIDELDTRLWTLFVNLFSVGRKIDANMHPFSVLISGADQEWLDRCENIEHLRECFKGCVSFLCADFPALNKEDEEWEEELKEIRQDSLKTLEDELAKLRRFDLECRFGRRSKKHIKIQREFARTDLVLEKNTRIKLIVQGASMFFSLSDLITRLTSLVTVDQRIALVPNCT